jgi:hypothetical protein
VVRTHRFGRDLVAEEKSDKIGKFSCELRVFAPEVTNKNEIDFNFSFFVCWAKQRWQVAFPVVELSQTED